MKSGWKTLSVRVPPGLEAKLEKTAKLLVDAGKLDKKGARSELIRKVLNGACDDILNTPIGELGAPKDNADVMKIEYGCEKAPICEGFPLECSTCKYRRPRKDYYEKEEEGEDNARGN